MPTKFPKPFYRTARSAWFVQVGGRQIKLGPDRDAAFRRYHEIMGRPEEVAPRGDSTGVADVLDAFLDWCLGHKAARTYDWYRNYLESFARSLPAGIDAARLRPFHVQEWLDANPGWKTGKRGAVIAVQRAFNWAVCMGWLDANPIRSVEKPKAGRRDRVIAPGQYREILGLVGVDEFRDLLAACWETGCRPQEVLAVEARHVDPDGGRWVFPPDEAKGKKAHRVVYLTEVALEITRRLAACHPEGPLFRNTDGRPWHPYALNCRFGRIRLAHGRQRIQELGLMPPRIKRLDAVRRREPEARAEHERAVSLRRECIAALTREHGTKWCLYHFRHSFATRMLAAGTDALTVSALLGHADGAMLAKVYSHLSKNVAYLRDAVRVAGTAHEVGRCCSPEKSM